MCYGLCRIDDEFNSSFYGMGWDGMDMHIGAESFSLSLSLLLWDAPGNGMGWDGMGCDGMGSQLVCLSIIITLPCGVLIVLCHIVLCLVIYIVLLFSSPSIIVLFLCRVVLCCVISVSNLSPSSSLILSLSYPLSISISTFVLGMERDGMG